MTDSSQLVLRHFEKVFLGLACAGLVLAWVSASPDSALQVASLDHDVNVIRNYMGSRRPTQPVSSGDPVGDLEVRLSAVPQAESFPSWLPYRRPAVWPTERQTKKRHGKHGVPSLSAARVGHSIRLTWVEPKVSDFLIPSYVLERQLDSRPWEELGTYGAGQTTHLDEGLLPRLAYRYRLTSKVEIDPLDEQRSAARRERLFLASAERTRVTAPTPPLSIPSDVFLTPHTVWVADPLARQQARAYIMVWIRTETGFRKKGFPVDEGSLIGAEIEVGLRTVDFRSHAKLVSVSERVEHLPQGRTRTIGVIKVRWPDGKVEELTTATKVPK